MKKYILAFVLATAALVPAASSLAADLEPPPPPVEDLRPTNYDWTGFYVGGWVGATCIEGELSDNSVPPAVDWELSGCGAKGGILAGYNHQFENWVVGLEADWGMSNEIATNEEVVATGADFAFTMDHIATLRARFGIALDDTLLFATVGGAWARGDLDAIIAADPDHIKGDHWGWTVGGGVEQVITENIRLKLDYLYTRFSGDNYFDTGCAVTCDVDVNDFDDHEVRVGAIWAF